MHTVVVRRELLQSNEWLADELLAGFAEAKRRAWERLRETDYLPYGLVWCVEESLEQEVLFGGEHWPYGVDANHQVLSAFVGALTTRGSPNGSSRCTSCSLRALSASVQKGIYERTLLPSSTADFVSACGWPRNHSCCRGRRGRPANDLRPRDRLARRMVAPEHAAARGTRLPSDRSGSAGHGFAAASPGWPLTVDGFGEFILQLVDTLAVESPVVLVGHSLGGHASALAALQKPDLTHN